MSEHTSSDANEASPLVDEAWRTNVRDNYGVSPIIRESRDSVTIRRPLSYNSLLNIQTTNASPPVDERTAASINRYKYYNKLSSQGGESSQLLLMPNHVVPPEFFWIIPIRPPGGKQNSLITIFSIWNTMMGTSLLSMPWALSMAGFGFGLVLMVGMAGLTLYTAYRVLKSTETVGNESSLSVPEFSDVCRYYLGRWGEHFSVIFSLIALVGAAIVYWVLMTNFLYNTVTYIYHEAHGEMNTTAATVVGNISYSDAYCPSPPPIPTPSIPTTTVPTNHSGRFLRVPTPTPTKHVPEDDTVFDRVWRQTLTVPLFLLIVIVPLINFKSPTFFTKFNALGTVSVLYILTFVIVKAARWGFHVDFTDMDSIWYMPEFRWTFPALTGTLSLAYFIHNCVISIVQNQKHPENNGRDLSIAYICVAFTYVCVGVVFYCSFPLAKSCIQDNLLNNFRGSDMMAFFARICLFIQMTTVFPLLMYIMRVQVLYAIFGNIYPSLKHVLVLNAIILTVCVLFAIFLPQIGTIIRFSGALCGLVYIFSLPCVVYLLSKREQGTLTIPVLIIHVVLILLGVLNFIGQFIIL